MKRYIAAGLMALSLTTWLGGCGGGVGSGGTGSPVGYAEGSVTGFGSVIVDGKRFDDLSAVVQVERAPGEMAAAELLLGQQVEMRLDDTTQAQSIRVEAQVLGQVSSVVPASGTLVVLGQTVRTNADPNAGPVTLLSGYASLGDVQLGDVVEVHAVLRSDATQGAYLQATRIEKRTGVPAYWRVSGVVSDLGATAVRFRLAGLDIDYSGAQVVPAGQGLANGQTVVVLGNAVQAGAGRPLLTAQQVRIKQRANSGLDADVGGVVDGLDTGAQRFVLNGVTVRYGGANVTPRSRTLANGVYVQATGSFASDGALEVTHLKIRNKQDESEVELFGTLTDLDDANKRFELRGVQVDFSSATLAGCPAGLASGHFVEVTGGIAGGGVKAERIKCSQEQAGAVVERSGTVASVDVAASTFVLESAAVSVRWNGGTYFGDGLTPQTLACRALEVEGNFSGGVLIAKRIHADD